MPSTNGHNQQGKKDRDFAGRKLKSLPKSIFDNCEIITKVDLQRNRLKQVSGISQLVNLTELILSRNELADFPEEIGKLHHLKTLYINQNIIKCISEKVFPSLQKLEFLKLSTNRLMELPSDINQCRSLIYLNASNNYLKDLQALVGVPKLRDLYVENNRLTDLPGELFANLTMFKATGNPLRKPPGDICIGGLKDIRSYFTMLRDSSSPVTVKTIKTMFLGSSMAGKSTLCRSFQSSRPVEVDVADRTVGIEIIEVEKGGVRFLCWDFAGQEEYYITHHVFITPQAFVILAIDLSSYDPSDPQSFEEHVSFWISNIQLRVPDSVVLPVGTHVDQCLDIDRKKKHINSKLQSMLTDRTETLQQLKKKLQESDDPSLYSDQMNDLSRLTHYKLKVLDLLLVDCTKPGYIQMFQDHTLKEVTNKDNFPSIERTLPGIYQEVEKEIQDLLIEDDIPQHGRVTLSDLLDIYISQKELDPENIKCILRYFHRIGVIVWYEEIESLKNDVFLKPSILITLFKAIIRHDLEKKIKDITMRQLKSMKVLNKHRETWLSDYKEKATLHNVAISILVQKELETLHLDDADLVQEIVGNGNKPGSLLCLLQHFEVCLPTKITSPLNPTAPEFHPNKTWVASNPNVYDPDSACMFPSYLQNNDRVFQMWGEDKMSDLTVHIYFIPEIPYGFFHRLVIKTCPLYTTHWVGKDQCCFSSCKTLTLIQVKNVEGDQYINIRCKEQTDKNEIKKSWKMVQEIMLKMDQLAQEWPGLIQYVHSPCKEYGCSAYFQWRDWTDWLKSPGSGKSDSSTKEEKVTCRNGHTRRIELIYPKGLFNSDSTENQAA
ncbi:malignant fibrous histiocytoma-amplified sequence 1 homolog isoform X1 [Alosa sapidissima]|uniref:malignant fibrous histiocytoma-amplified sequence 1 homolog isoform X1 n=1 Tax=Alosa sapidissima TaxID=34773 RepID=UPI001C093FBA|nr:malignant fibrous histiocytoma-amplified sequence 1 homolog isoform X1 [Alosa sapidissima]